MLGYFFVLLGLYRLSTILKREISHQSRVIAHGLIPTKCGKQGKLEFSFHRVGKLMRGMSVELLC